MNPKGRPSNQKTIMCQHDERSRKPQTLKQYWTEHRLTLIAYQAQYIYAKQPNEYSQERGQTNESKKKGSRKKVNLQYQSSFLSIASEDNQNIKVEELIKGYDSLMWLFNERLDLNFSCVREFVKILLELKHSVIAKEFCEIYNIIVRELKTIDFSDVEKQEPRFQFLEGVKQRILNQIEKYKQRFPYFTQYLKQDQKETKKLLLVEAYCLLAQRFNFNINEFYSEAFTVNPDSKPTKKVKK